MSDLPHLLALGLSASWRIAFLTLSAPVTGAVLLLAIARVTGTRWTALQPLAAMAPWLMPTSALLGLCQLPVPAPDHLVIWMSWWAVSLRALIATAAISFASLRLRDRASTTFAAVVLTIYAVLVTPVASDWMLGQAPGHPVSAIGMMHLTSGIAGATAAVLALGWGPIPFRRDMAKLMIAASLGLGYLVYMDYLIVWYGNLPSHVGFYVERSSATMGALVWGGLVAGLAAPILLLWLVRQDWGQRCAGAGVLAALLIFDVWWVAGGVVAGLAGFVLTIVGASALWRGQLRGESHV